MINDIVSLIKKNEGLRLSAYDDETGQPVAEGGACKGTLTIGFGHTGPDVLPGMVITEDQAELFLRGDILTATRALQAVIGFPLYVSLSINEPARCAALLDMAFNLGQSRLSGFRNMIAAVKAGSWTAAAMQAMESEWFRQVGNRAREDAVMLQTGQWPDQEAAVA